MSGIVMILLIFGVFALIIKIIQNISNSGTNTPTWRGIIISALIGMLPLYLILCFLGAMGESNDNKMN